LFRKGSSRRRTAVPRYFVYLSEPKIDMLYPQIPSRLLGSLEAEIKASVGLAQATIKAGLPDRGDLYTRASVVSRYLEKHDQVGSIDQPAQYVRGHANFSYGIPFQYLADLAFFGAITGTGKVGLIGSPESMIGAVQRNETEHSVFYYTLAFLRQLADQEAAGDSELPYFGYSEAFDIAMKACKLKVNAEFLAKVIHHEPGLLLATPLYVAATD